MAYDEGLAQLMREDLAETAGIAEKKMFGGVAFMLNGHMLCGVHSGGAMYRVGKENEDAALAIPGARPMVFTGRRMGGFVDIDDAALADDARRAGWLELAMNFVAPLPPK